MKVLLISPTYTARLPDDYGRPSMYEPLGLGYIAAVIRDAGHEPIILDCVAEDWHTQTKEGAWTTVGLTPEALKQRVLDIHPDIVGITCMFTGFERDVFNITRLVKETLPAVPVIAGGADASARPEFYCSESSIDTVIRGEGEKAFLHLLETWAATNTIPHILPGISLPGQDNPLMAEIESIDSLPFPARDLMRMDVYLEDQRPLMPYAKRRPVGFLITSRGCPYNCIFCSTTRIWKHWRPRSAISVVDEIEHLIGNYGVREIAFQDDSFLVDPERVHHISQEIIRRKLDITWSVPPGLQANKLTDDLLHVMKQSGFYRCCFPIESGDPEMLKWIRKPIRLDHVEAAIDLCNRHGIWTYGNFIIGFPEQTAESIEKTAQYIEKCRLDMISIYIAQPYAGSDLYDVYRELGLLSPEKAMTSTIFNTRYDTLHFTAEQLTALRDQMFRRFMRKRFQRLFSLSGLKDLYRKINSPENIKYALRLAHMTLSEVLRGGMAARFTSRTEKRKKQS